MAENKLSLDRHLLVCFHVEVSQQLAGEYEYLVSHFCGQVLSLDENDPELLQHLAPLAGRSIYFCGDAARFRRAVLTAKVGVRFIQELCINLPEDSVNIACVGLGEVPLNLHDVAVYYRNCLGNNDTDYYARLQAKHEFQALTESNKPNVSFRKGIYLSEVESSGNGAAFNLLRCSSNLSGPTLAFAEEDREIVARVNELADQSFESRPHLNHVLAQVYENSVTVDDAHKVKEHRAKIKSHSDKTRQKTCPQMVSLPSALSTHLTSIRTSLPRTIDSIDASRTQAFLRESGSNSSRMPASKVSRDTLDPSLSQPHMLHNSGGLTGEDVSGREIEVELLLMPLAGYRADFHVTLYPNSVLLIPLSTNRLYIHEIVPPQLPVGRFPTRLGYVVRCSKTKAVFKNGATILQRPGGAEVRLRKAEDGEVDELKELY